MKITARDKKLLIGLGIFIFVIVFVKFLFLPKLNSINKLNEEIDTLNNTYATNQLHKSKINDIDSDIKILYERLKNVRSVYPPKIDISELIMTMQKINTLAELEITSMTFEDCKPVTYGGRSDTASTTTTANTTGSASTTGAADSTGTPASDTTTSTDAANTQSGTQTTATAGTQQITDAGNIINSKILKYLYLWGLKPVPSVSSDANTNANSNGTSDTNSKEKVPDGKGYYVTVKIEATGTNDQIKKYLTSISELGTKAYCKTTSIVPVSGQIMEEDEVKKLKFTAEIAFYGIMDQAAGGYYMIPSGDWIPKAPANEKTDLFKLYKGYYSSPGSANSLGDLTGGSAASNGDKSDASKEETDVGSYDFAVVASAFGGGLAPSVSVSCKNPGEDSSFSRPVVYGDNKGIENVEIFIEQKNGKYYCKFKTDHEAYPNDKYTQTFEFIPEGNELRLVILSSARMSENDKAGVKIDIINNSSKNLTYTVMYDDTKSPRVKIDKTVGSVNKE